MNAMKAKNEDQTFLSTRSSDWGLKPGLRPGQQDLFLWCSLTSVVQDRTSRLDQSRHKRQRTKTERGFSWALTSCCSVSVKECNSPCNFKATHSIFWVIMGWQLIIPWKCLLTLLIFCSYGLFIAVVINEWMKPSNFWLGGLGKKLWL